MTNDLRNDMTTNTMSNLKPNSIDLSSSLTFYDVITNVRDDKY